MNGKFELGRLVCTAGIYARVSESDEFNKFVKCSLDRYVMCDWGNTCEEDAETNDHAFLYGERILAAYTYPTDGTVIWIITEWDRSATTILFPSEY